MKHLLFFFAALCAMPLFAEVTKEGDGAAKLDRESRNLSFLLLVQEKLEKFAVSDYPAGKEKIAVEMRRNPKSYAIRSVARNKAEAIYRAEMEKDLQKEIASLTKSTVKELTAPQRQKLDGILRSVIDKRTKQLFPAAFDEVRKQLAEEERKSLIFTAIYPTGKELETLNDAELTAKLIQRFNHSAKHPLMEENRPYLQQNLVSPVIAAGRKQQRVQNELLPRIRVPQTLWEAAPTGDFLRRELRAATMRELPETPTPFIEFPAIAQKIRHREKHIAYEHIGDVMPELLSSEDYRALLEKEPHFHTDRASSLARCQAMWLGALLDRAMKTLRAPQAIQKKITADDPVIQKIFAEKASTKFQPVREKYAAQQIKRVWSDLDSWLPRLEDTELFVQQGEKELPAVADRPKSKEPVFEETQKLIAVEMRKKFVEETRRLKLQQKAVAAVYSSITEECRTRDQKYRAGDVGFFQKFFGIANDAITLKEIIKVYSEKVEKESSSPLFPSVQTEIEIRARAILQQLQAKAQKADKQKDTPQEPPKPVETFVLTISGKSDTDFALQLGTWRQTLSGGKLPAKAIADELKRQLEGKEVETILSIEVANPSITYRCVAELREALQELLEGATIQDVYRK